jgi:hypothetical protein
MSLKIPSRVLMMRLIPLPPHIQPPQSLILLKLRMCECLKCLVDTRSSGSQRSAWLFTCTFFRNYCNLTFVKALSLMLIRTLKNLKFVISNSQHHFFLLWLVLCLFGPTTNSNRFTRPSSSWVLTKLCLSTRFTIITVYVFFITLFFLFFFFPLFLINRSYLKHR